MTKMTDYRFDDDGTYADHWAGFDANMMGDAAMSDDRSVSDITDHADVYRYARDRNRSPYVEYDSTDAIVSDHAGITWDREASPNTRTPVPYQVWRRELTESVKRIERERATREHQEATQAPHKSFWRRATQAMLTWGWF